MVIGLSEIMGKKCCARACKQTFMRSRATTSLKATSLKRGTETGLLTD